MYKNITEYCQNVIRRSSRTFAASFVIGEQKYSDIKSLKVMVPSVANGKITIGGTVSKNVEIVVDKVDVLPGMKMCVYEGVKLDSGEYEDIPIGTYKIRSAVTKAHMTTIVAEGPLSTETSLGYFSELTYPATTIQMVEEISEAIGVQIVTDNLEELYVASKPEGYTYREVVGFIAAMHGTNAVEMRDGSIAFKWYEYCEDDIFTDKADTPELSNDTFTIEKFECETGNATITRGAGKTGIVISNPLLTEAAADVLWERIAGFGYRPATFSIKSGTPLVDEWNYFSYEGENVIATELQFIHDGGLQNSFKSVGESETASSSGYKGPLAKALERYQAEMVLVKEALVNKLSAEEADIRYLQADKLDVITAEVKSAVIKNLEGDFATFEALNVTNAKVAKLDVLKLSTKDLSAEVAKLGYATIEQLDASVARIVALEANQITVVGLKTEFADIALSNVAIESVGRLFADVGLITDATIQNGKVTGYLDSVEVNANSITAGTLSVDRLIFRGSENSIVYELNNITGALQSVQSDTLNGEILTDRSITVDKIVAKSITANEIAAGTITATELNVSNIFSNSAVIGTLTTQSAFINAISTNSIIVGAQSAANNALNAVNNLEIGGRNLLAGTSSEYKSVTLPQSMVNVRVIYTADLVEKYGLKDGDKLTASIYLKPSGTKRVQLRVTQTGGTIAEINLYSNIIDASSEGLCTITFAVNTQHPTIAIRYQSADWSTVTANTVEYYKCLKLEKGNKATDWTPAPEDVDSSITSVQNTANTANTIAGTALSTANGITSNIYVSGTTTINGGKIATGTITANQLAANSITASKLAITDVNNFAELNSHTYSAYGFKSVYPTTTEPQSPWFEKITLSRDNNISRWYSCSGGEKFRVKAEIFNSVYGQPSGSGTTTAVPLSAGIMIFTINADGSRGYFDGSARVGSTSSGNTGTVNTVISLPSTARQFAVFIQLNGWGPFTGTLRVRNVEVYKMSGGELIVDGSITADKIDVNNLFAQAITATGTITSSNMHITGGSIIMKYDEDIDPVIQLIGTTYGTRLWLAPNRLETYGTSVYDYTTEVRLRVSPQLLQYGILKYNVSTKTYYMDSSTGIDLVYHCSDSGRQFHTALMLHNYTGKGGIFLFTFPEKYASANLPVIRVTNYDYTKYVNITANAITTTDELTISSSTLSVTGAATLSSTLTVAGNLTAKSKIIATGSIYTDKEFISYGTFAFRSIYGNYGAFWHNNGNYLYLMFTNSGDQWGSWSSLRPMYFNMESGSANFGHTVAIDGYLHANSRIICGEHVMLNNARGIYCKNTSGADVEMMMVSTDNNGYLGWGAAGLKIGSAANTGKLELFSKGRIDFLSGGVANNNGYAISIIHESGYPILRPTANSGADLGTNSYRFRYMRLTYPVDVSSDRRLKSNISDLDDRYMMLAKLLSAKSYYLNIGGTNRRYVGYIAQDVEEAMNKVGLTYEECSFFNRNWVERDDYKGYELSLVYEELHTLQIASLQKQVNELQNALAMANAKITHLQLQHLGA